VGVGGKEQAKRAGKKLAGEIERERTRGENFAKNNEREWSWRETTSGK
jgi:hypothetical protein